MNMCSAYANSGHHVDLYVSSEKDEVQDGFVNEFSQYGVGQNFRIRRVPVPSGNLGRLFSMSIVSPLLSKVRGVDLVHSRNLSAAWGAARLFNVPVVYEMHNAPETHPRRMAQFQQLVRSRNFVSLVVITNALKTHLQDLVPRNVNIIVAPDGVNESSLSAEHDTPPDLVHHMGSAPLAIYTGHLYEGRGIDLIISLATLVPEYHFYIIGGNPQDVTRYKDRTKLMSNMTLLGYRPPSEIPSYQSAADALLMPYADNVQVAGAKGDTARFASPLKMFEYMAAGKPILSSQLPVLTEILKDGHNALLLPFDNPAAWVNALKMLRSSPALGQALGRQARADVESFTWINRSRKIIEAVQPVIKQR